MQLKHTCAALLLLAASSGLTGCVPELLEPFENPPPRERVVSDNYEKYDFIPAAKKTVILNEEFNANTRGWRVVTTSPEYSLTIEGGALDMFTRYNTQLNTISLPELKGTDDFEVEAAIRIEYTWTWSGAVCTLLWGGSTTAARQWSFFSFNNDNRAVAVGRVNDSYDVYKLNYSYDEYNTVIIRKVKNTYYYFINGMYLGKQPFTRLDGTKIGFEVAYNTQVYVDYLRVRRLMP